MKTMMNALEEASKGKKHLIFDFDETIFFIHPDWAGLKEEVYRLLSEISPEHKKLVESALSENETKKRRNVVTQLTKKYGKPVHDIIRNSSKKREKTVQRPTEKHQAIIDFIEEKGNLGEQKMHIRSSNHTATFMPYLEKRNLAKYFSTFVGMDTIELIKKYPDGFYHIQNIYGGEKKDYLMVGNSKFADGGAAERAGIDYFFIDSNKVDWEVV